VKTSLNKTIGLLSVSGLLLWSACGQQGAGTKPGAVQKTVSAQAGVATDFYKRLEGTIAGQPVVMQLCRHGGVYSGTYYYRSANGSGEQLIISSDSVLKDPAEVYLAEFDMSVSDMEETHATLRCRWNGNKLTGTWVSGDHKKQFPVDLTEAYPEGSYAFEYLNYSDSLAAVPGKKDGPVADVSYTYLVPVANDKAGKWLNRQIKRMLYLGDSSEEANIPQLVKQSSRSYLGDYQSSIGEELKGADEGMMASMDYSNSTNLSINFNDNGFVVFEAGVFDYSGGAHGNYGSSMHCLDVYEQKELKLSDIITLDSAGLQALVETYFRQQYDLAPTDSLNGILFENALPANDNFYFNDKALGFLYNPYEVASYAQGQIFVSIPFSALSAYLVPAFKERMRL